jgi:RNA polymerase sigma-70 factor (ECF subfamily)
MLVVHEAGPAELSLMAPGAEVNDDRDDQYAWFFRAQFPGVVRAVYLISHDRQVAEDVAQEAFTQLLVHWTKVSRYERPEAWVRRVAIRLAVRATRRDERRRVLHRDIEPTQPRGPGDPDLIDALRRLPPQQRAAIALFYFEDRPVDEVAAILACSPATARVHLHKARHRLAALLGEPMEEVSDAS